MDIQVLIPWDADAKEGSAHSVSDREEVPQVTKLTEPSVLSIELHPNARDNFDAKAHALLSELISAPAEVEADAGAAPRRNLEQIATPLPDNAVQRAVEVFRNGDGEIVARSFVHAGMITGLQGEGYRALRRLAEAMQRTSALRMLIGVNTLELWIFEWVRSRVVSSTDASMSHVVLARVATRIADYEVVLPLFRVELPGQIQIGRVLLRTITSADFVRWEESVIDKTKSPTEKNQLHGLFHRERQRVQGFVGAVMSLRGERNHVIEVASEEADEAVSILRLFSHAILSPLAQSFCTLWGRQHIESTAHLVFRSSHSEVTIGNSVRTTNDFIWRIDADRWRLIRQDALDALIQALFASNPTAFQDEVKAAIVLYSQSALSVLPAEKLLTILIPLESLLLRNQSEPIADNIAIRVAFATGETLEERKRIVDVVKEVYGMRSAYVHHRRAISGIEALETLREFMQYAWRFFVSVGIHAGEYQDRGEYLNSLDDRKLA